jgi:hypothetical protein
MSKLIRFLPINRFEGSSSSRTAARLLVFKSRCVVREGDAIKGWHNDIFLANGLDCAGTDAFALAAPIQSFLQRLRSAQKIMAGPAASAISSRQGLRGFE